MVLSLFPHVCFLLFAHLLFSSNKEQTKEIQESIGAEGKKNRDQTVATGNKVVNTVESSTKTILDNTVSKEDLGDFKDEIKEQIETVIAQSMKKAKEEDLVDKTEGIKPTSLKFDGGEDDTNTQVSTLDSSSAAETECEEKPGGFRKVFASAKKVKLPFSRMNGRE